MQQFWCTGKDSNLRTSLGGTDLQSVGFNHSPTCAETAGRCSRRASSRRPSRESADRSSTLVLRVHQTLSSQTSQTRETKNRAYDLPREDHCTPENFRIEVRWKNLLRHPEFRCLPEIRFLTLVYWSWRRDSNPRPSVYKTDALPTELRQHSGTSTLPGTSRPLIPSRCPGQLIKLSQAANSTQPACSDAQD
jgi:hypothetical protein